MNGYIQIDFNGHPIGLKFGYNSVKWFAFDCDKYYSEYFETVGEVTQMTAAGLASLLHSAYRNNQLLKKEPETIEMMDFYDWVVEKNLTPEGQELLKRIDEVYADSREVKLFIKNLTDATDDIKKKIREQSLNVSN